MAQVLVRNLRDKVVARLKKRAAQRGRSLQAEVKQILEDAAAEADQTDVWKGIEEFPAGSSLGSGLAFSFILKSRN